MLRKKSPVTYSARAVAASPRTSIVRLPALEKPNREAKTVLPPRSIAFQPSVQIAVDAPFTGCPNAIWMPPTVGRIWSVRLTTGSTCETISTSNCDGE